MDLSVFEYSLVFNSLSFGIATFGAATIFFFLQRSQVAPAYRGALTITGLVTLIALYHYVRILDSWQATFVLENGVVTATGKTFNDAYRYVDWLLTVPLLLVELIAVMGLSRMETWTRGTRLGLLAALMIVLGYPGEISDVASVRWIWWAAAMVPFLWIVYELVVGLGKSISEQPAQARGLVSTARWIVIVTWSFYPVVFLFPMLGLTGSAAETAVQVGYTVADVAAKAVFGVVIYLIAVRRSEAEGFRA
ncbi:MAG: bacteriorhodopsin-like [Alphaproteobacteria bacterium]